MPKQRASEHPASEHPASEHPASEHPASEHPASAAIVELVFLVLVAVGCVEPEPLIDAGVQGCVEAIEAEELTITNEERAAMGISQLVCDPQLAAAAELHSQDMCDNSYFSHTGFDGSNPGDRITAQGASFTTWGENIAQGPSSATTVHALWMGSPGHRANILNEDFGRIGIGYVACGGVHLWTQVFAD